jgi:Ser/Thr protein kinase RdoA (MazF antagonist)
MSSLVAWANGVLDWKVVETHDLSWPHAASNVTRLHSRDGERAYLKIHRQPRKFEQEYRALVLWAPLLPATPRILGIHPSPRHALLLSEVPGVLVEGAALSSETLTRVHLAAGAWLQRLHRLPHDDLDALKLQSAVNERLSRWSQRASGFVSATTLAWVAAQVEAADLSRVRRVPCHRDYGPRNWLWDDEHGLGVIDFEHSLPDLWWADVGRLIDEGWYGQPALEEAFWDGYGRIPSAEERALGDAFRAMTALGTISWARAHQDTDFERQGWRVLQRLGAPL